jgi:hypothetical protein
MAFLLPGCAGIGMNAAVIWNATLEAETPGLFDKQ